MYFIQDECFYWDYRVSFLYLCDREKKKVDGTFLTMYNTNTKKCCMHYISFSEDLKSDRELANIARKGGDIHTYLEALIFSEQPYLAKATDVVDEESRVLYQHCQLFNSILNNEELSVDDFYADGDLYFENKHHCLTSLLNGTAYKYLVCNEK